MRYLTFNGVTRRGTNTGSGDLRRSFILEPGLCLTTVPPTLVESCTAISCCDCCCCRVDGFN